MPEHVEFFEAVVTAYPDDADHAPLLKDPVHARVARAGDVVDGDLILAAVSLRGADYFNDQYTAHPWPTCDPWLADALVLIIPARPLPDRTAKE
jgi:hypothetical protein